MKISLGFGRESHDKHLLGLYPVEIRKAWTLLYILALVILGNGTPKEFSSPNSSESRMTLETIISVGVLGWLAMGMVLMGLGIW